ncbi:MAG: phosphate ABC transporter permease PstA [Pseudanabaena sp. RU_4_16]|nr:phosphate ABC transporter permease PstA [Pseudanabaena sp. RU_4_16]
MTNPKGESLITSLQQLQANVSRRKMWDYIFIMFALLSLLVGVVTLLALVLQLFITGLPRLNWQFFTSVQSRNADEAGILTALVGSSLVMLVTGFTAIPLGIAAGTYLEEYAKKNWFTDLIEINVTNLAGVPSIVYGLLALGLFVRQFQLGESVAAAGLTLALLILPVVIVTTREAIKSIPVSIREAAYALGSSKWQTVWDHVLPYSMGGILTGIIVGLSRAIGETAPVITIGALTFITFLPDPPIKGEFPFISFEWLKAPFTVMPIQMFDWISRPDQDFQINAAAAGIVLVVMTLLMNGTAIYLRYYFRKRVNGRVCS